MGEEPHVQLERWWVQGSRAYPSLPFTPKFSGIVTSLRWSGPQSHHLIQEKGKWIAIGHFLLPLLPEGLEAEDLK